MGYPLYDSDIDLIIQDLLLNTPGISNECLHPDGRIYLLHRLMEDNIYAENYIYRRTAERFSDVMWSMGQLLFSSFDKRLAAYLADEQVKSRTNTISTTHEQVAKNLGTAREVVSRMLKYFEKEGIVSLGRGTITVVDTRKLRKLLA